MTGVDGFVISSLNFKQIVMANCNALEITIGCQIGLEHKQSQQEIINS